MAVGVAMLMIGGEFDLSTGVGVISSALVASMFSFQLNANVWVGVLVALIFSLAVGLFNGWVVMATGIPSFLVTLGTFLMLRGANIAVTKIVTGGVASPTISDMEGFSSARALFASNFTLFGQTVRVTVIYWLLLVALSTWVLLRTKIGNWIFAVGGNAASARAVGVPVRRVKIGLFMFVGFCAWVLGMHQLFAFNTVQSGGGVREEFSYIIAAVIGGTGPAEREVITAFGEPVVFRCGGRSSERNVGGSILVSPDGDIVEVEVEGRIVLPTRARQIEGRVEG